VLRRDATLRPAARYRVEMVLRSAVGWSPPRIAPGSDKSALSKALGRELGGQ
jgi:hypothetical protein